MSNDHPEQVEIRELTADHRALLEGFQCVTPQQSWTRDVQETIRETVPDLIESGDAHALGAFRGETLCSVIVWTVEGDDRWVSAACATATGFRKRHYASRLKNELLRRAHQAGARSVVSFVRVKNETMLDINQRLHATIRQDPTDRNYMVCTFRLN